jgi:hypothetical protein
MSVLESAITMKVTEVRNPQSAMEQQATWAWT